MEEKLWRKITTKNKVWNLFNQRCIPIDYYLIRRWAHTNILSTWSLESIMKLNTNDSFLFVMTGTLSSLSSFSHFFYTSFIQSTIQSIISLRVLMQRPKKKTTIQKKLYRHDTKNEKMEKQRMSMNNSFPTYSFLIISRWFINTTTFPTPHSNFLQSSILLFRNQLKICRTRKKGSKKTRERGFF